LLKALEWYFFNFFSTHLAQRSASFLMPVEKVFWLIMKPVMHCFFHLIIYKLTTS